MKTRKVFVDVGGFEGDSARAALDPRFGFDAVYCFEPVRACYEFISATLRHPRLQIVNAGLLDTDDTLPVYGPGTLGASVFGDAPAVAGAAAPVEVSTFQRASHFFATHMASSDRVWMKLNCEGSEVAILEDLMASGEAGKLEEVLIDFDAAHIPSRRAGMERVLRLLGDAPFAFHFPEEVQYGMVNNFGGIRNWLLASGAAENRPLAVLASIPYNVRHALDPRFNGYYKILVLRSLGLKPPPPLQPSPLRKRIESLRP